MGSKAELGCDLCVCGWPPGCCGGSGDGGDALKLCRRLECLFPNTPEALSLAVVATGRTHKKDLEEAAWPCLISRARGDGERRYGDQRSEGHPREDRCAGAAWCTERCRGSLGWQLSNSTQDSAVHTSWFAWRTGYGTCMEPRWPAGQMTEFKTRCYVLQCWRLSVGQ